MAVMRLAVHPTKVDLCSGSTTVCSVQLMAVLRDVMLNGELSRSCSLPLLFDAMPDETRRGAKKGDLGGSACLLDGEGVIVSTMKMMGSMDGGVDGANDYHGPRCVQMTRREEVDFLVKGNNDSIQ